MAELDDGEGVSMVKKSYCPQPRYCSEYQERAKLDGRQLFTLDLYDKFGEGGRITETGVLSDNAIDWIIERLERRRSKSKERK